MLAPQRRCVLSNITTSTLQLTTVCLFVKKFQAKRRDRPTLFMGKTDLSSAFRVLPLLISCICWLVLKAEDPCEKGKFKFFIDKCLPFGVSLSCSHYQLFSNALKHIIAHRTKQKTITNYLDDFLFIALMKSMCNNMIQKFLGSMW